MAAAAITLWDGDWDRKLKRTVPWGWVGIVCVSGGILFRSAPLSGPHWARLQSASLPDQILFGGVAALLVWCAAGIGGPRKTVKAFLDSEPVAGLGGFSYSLYLTHYPLLAIFWLWVDKLPISDGWKLTFMVGFGLIVCVPFGYLFYRLFERPFMSSAAKRRHPELAKLTEAAPRL
jgi:peptidoglycan/LPS O-acetylase OafA/YrhL